MSLNELCNCSRCGDLFVYRYKDVCPRCLKKVEEDFEICVRYLRNKENRQATMNEMSEKTGVSVDQITEFIREKRLLIDQVPNLSFPCEGCGTLIRSGRLCESCASNWKKELDVIETKDHDQETDKQKKTGGFYINQSKYKI